MEFLAQLSRDQDHANPLAILLKTVATELEHFKMAMLVSHRLSPACFQVTGFCDNNHCPVYTADAMLTRSEQFPILHGEFIEAWKTLYEPQIISCSQCPDLFQHELKYFGEAIIVPIWIEGLVERWIVIVDYQDNDNMPDLTRLSLILNYTLTNILRAEQKRQLDKARKWIDDELAEISRIQSLLLPPDDIQLPGTQIAFKFEAFKDAGGDYLDLFSLPVLPDSPNTHRWGGVIADVTGHGPSAAVEAAMVDAIFRTFRGNESTTPADAANYLNENFFTRRDRGKFVTAKLFSYHSEGRCLRYVSAGHPTGYIKRGESIFALDGSKGIPIGVLPDYQWVSAEFDVQPGDILFVYTDVVLETRNPEGEEFGDKNLLQTLREAPAEPQEIVDRVEKALVKFCGLELLQDDLTICAIKIEA